MSSKQSSKEEDTSDAVILDPVSGKEYKFNYSFFFSYSYSYLSLL